MRSRIVMDVDGVISTHRNRDYENAIPNKPIIKKMQELSKQGVEFVLYTARGQISCNGDMERIEKEKGPTLRAWLKKHNVPYSELRFGKPIGDVYVDDAAMTPDEFLYDDFVSYRGGSNGYVERLGKFVVKEYDNVDVVAVRDWFDKARENHYCVPYVYNVTYNKMLMEHVRGTPGNLIDFERNPRLAIDIATTAISFASVPGKYEFNIDDYVRYIYTNLKNAITDNFVYKAEKLAIKYCDKVIPSFCHGDLTSMNTIIKGNGDVFMIDPIPHNKFSSYLMDLAKLRMSFNGYNWLFYTPTAKYSDKKHLEVLDTLLNNLGISQVVRALEFTCWVRLIKYRYNNKSEYQILISRLQTLSEEVSDL